MVIPNGTYDDILRMLVRVNILNPEALRKQEINIGLVALGNPSCLPQGVGSASGYEQLLPMRPQ